MYSCIYSLYYITRIYLILYYLNYSLNIPCVIYLVLSYLDTGYNNLKKYCLLLIDIVLPIIHILIVLSIEYNKINICLLFYKTLNNLQLQITFTPYINSKSNT